MSKKHYTRKEALALQGKVIQTKVKFADVPEGTFGRIVGYYKFSTVPRLYHVDIKWIRFDNDHLIDGFSKDEVEDFLEVF